jgi:hypothetical protein
MSAIAAIPLCFAEHEGRGITVAVVDSGINFNHPHLALSGRGFAVVREEEGLVIQPGAHADRYGHGTCCAALLHALAPAAAIMAVRVTSDRPTTDAERLARGIVLGAEEGANILLVPLGTQTVLTLVKEAVSLVMRRRCVARSRPGVQPAACRQAQVRMGRRDARRRRGALNGRTRARSPWAALQLLRPQPLRGASGGGAGAVCRGTPEP